MLSVMQGLRPNVDTDKLLRELGIQIMKDIKTNFLDYKGKSWILINPSLHSMCAHAWQFYDIFSGPIAKYSEQSQEHWNKFVNKYKSGCGARARQHGVSVNLADIFTRMLRMTHPIIASKKAQSDAVSANSLDIPRDLLDFTGMGQ